MNAVREFLGLFRNSPTFGRDRANLISGFTIGTTALILNASILMMVLPLMLDPNDRDFRLLTQNIEFGQLLGLILMGGASAFATLLIPIRLCTVLMGPRVGRYFDQIVLSGISPLRFLIGKVTSQNLFLGLILFLLLPWFVLVLALGGLEVTVFLGNLILVWLYCMMLAMVMLWLSLYMNEILAMLGLMYFAVVFCGLGCAPFPVQPFVVTPFPALMNTVYFAVGAGDVDTRQTYSSVFASCAIGMSAITLMAFAGIYLGPLYGIIRDNSTFGEVVKAGDSRRRRRFRFRLHIQRPSEIAFFYENRGDTFRKHEGLVRWSAAMLCLLVPTTVAWTLFVSAQAQWMPTQFGSSSRQWWVAEFHLFSHFLHGLGLFAALLLFSHAKNTTYLKLPVLWSWKPTVATLDWIGFSLFLTLSTSAAILVPMAFEQIVAVPAGTTLFPDLTYVTGGELTDYHRVSIEGTLALSVAALTLYVLQKTTCLYLWLKSAAMALVILLYGGFVCAIPAFSGIFAYEMLRHPDYAAVRELGKPVAAASPFVMFMNLYKESPRAWHDVPSLPFYVFHGMILVVCLPVIWKLSRRLKREYSGFQVGDARPVKESPPAKEVGS